MNYFEIKIIQYCKAWVDPVHLPKLLNKKGKCMSSELQSLLAVCTITVSSLWLCFGALQLYLSMIKAEQGLDMVYAMDHFQKAVTDKKDHARLSFLHPTQSPSIIQCDFTSSNTSLHLHIPPRYTLLSCRIALSLFETAWIEKKAKQNTLEANCVLGT